MRKLGKKLRRPKMAAIFRKYQLRAGIATNSMLLDCDTQWGSVYTMLQRAQEQKSAIKLGEDDAELNIVADSGTVIIINYNGLKIYPVLYY